VTWIRMDCSAPDDLVFDQLGEALGIESMQAFGHYFAVAGKLATLGTEGRLDTVLDRTLEQWAKWPKTPAGFSGVPSTFAAVFRRLCQDPETGELRGFRRRNEKLLQKQTHDAQKRKPPRNPQETREGLSGVPSENPRANGNGNSKEESLPPRLERRVKRLVLTDDEQAVIAHYRTRHPKRLRGDIPEKVVRVLRTALSAYPVTDLCKAIDGNAASPFHRENNHLGLALILRDSEKVDYFMGLYEQRPVETKEMTDEFGIMRTWQKNGDEWEMSA
jgi:hypothetical protein